MALKGKILGKVEKVGKSCISAVWSANARIFEFARGNGIFGHFLALKGISMGKILFIMFPKVLA